MDIRHLLSDELKYEMVLRNINTKDRNSMRRLEDLINSEAKSKTSTDRLHVNRLTRQTVQVELQECSDKLSEVTTAIDFAMREADDDLFARGQSRLVHITNRVRRLRLFTPDCPAVSRLWARTVEIRSQLASARDALGSGEDLAVDQETQIEDPIRLTADQGAISKTNSKGASPRQITIQQIPTQSAVAPQLIVDRRSSEHQTRSLEQLATQSGQPIGSDLAQGVNNRSTDNLKYASRGFPARARSSLDELSALQPIGVSQQRPQVDTLSRSFRQTTSVARPNAPPPHPPRQQHYQQPQMEQQQQFRRELQYDARSVMSAVDDRFEMHHNRNISPPQRLHSHMDQEHERRDQQRQQRGYDDARSVRSDVDDDMLDRHQPPPYRQIQAPPGRDNLTGGHRIHQWSLRFDGGQTGLDAEDFLFRVERQAQLYGVSHMALVMGFGELLRGRAEQWYWTYQRMFDGMTWEELRTAFRRRYAPHRATDHEIKTKMENRRQRAGEPFNNFCQDMEALASRLNRRMGDEELVEFIQRNMHMTLRKAMWRERVYSVEELLHVCTEYEKLCKEEEWQSRRNVRVHELSWPDQVDDRNDTQSRVELLTRDVEAVRLSGGRGELTICWNCKDIGHMFTECPKPRNGIFCYSCGLKGYVKFDCPKCAGNERRDGSAAIVSPQQQAGKPPRTNRPTQQARREGNPFGRTPQ